MRPLRLWIKGFTAFRDEQELDFAGLDVFALWGPTGSGKSSILDAMTYALYGKAERVEGSRDVSISELVSHGQKRLAVTLEFTVGNEHLRVTRSTPRSGSSSARLEVNEGGEWRSYGEGADRVRDVNATIEDLIGLDYDAFTRSVILPQGKFAEFLTGDAAERRKILIELLGLELFGRMAMHANQIAKEARLTVETTEKILADQFSGVSEDALAGARRAAKAAAKAAREADSIEKAVTASARRAEAIVRSRADIERSSQQAGGLVTSFSAHARTLDRLAGALGEAGDRIDAARIDLEKAQDAAEGAEADLAKAEAESGTHESLLALRAALGTLASARGERDRAVTRAEAAAVAVAGAAEELDGAQQRAAAARETAQGARAEHGQRQAELDDARRRDVVAALVHGLHVGDACPVCGSAIATPPEVELHALEAAEAALASAAANAAEAERAAADCDVAAARAGQALEGAGVEKERAETEVRERTTAVGAIENEIAEAFGGDVPEDADARIDGRIADLKALMGAVDDARRARADAQKALDDLELARTKSLGEVAAVRAEMRAARVETIVKEAGALLPELRSIVPGGDVPDGPDELARVAGAVASGLESLVVELDAGAARLSEELDSLVTQALETLPDEERPDSEDIAAVCEAAGDLRTRRHGESARLAAGADGLAEQLERKRALEKGMAAKKGERDLYAELGAELRTDRIVDYLQAEALAALAANGSVHLERLSDHRYRLCYENDRFYVIDAWNADEKRSVRTLSGGETFLASLALALALAEGVQMLAVTEKSRLESLFLDEGFGTLDAETLKAVVDALERLGSEDRLVGVITHITALAEEMPVRVEVAKSPRGSTLKIATREPAGFV